MWSELGKDLQCQRCPAFFMWRTDDRTTEYAARFNDWKVFRGPTESGGHTNVVLCPQCGGHIVQKRVPRHLPLPGQEEFLF